MYVCVSAQSVGRSHATTLSADSETLQQELEESAQKDGQVGMSFILAALYVRTQEAEVSI